MSADDYVPSDQQFRDWVVLIDTICLHGGASVGRFDRWLAAHDHEVRVDYEKRRKPDPILVDNIDGQRATEWLAAHDRAQFAAGVAAAREAVESVQVSAGRQRALAAIDAVLTPEVHSGQV